MVNGSIPSHCLFRNRKLENSIFMQVSDVSVGNMKLELLIERCLLSAKLIKIRESCFP